MTGRSCVAAAAVILASILAMGPGARAGDLPEPDLLIPPETCASTDLCRRLPVERREALPLTDPVACSDDGATCVLPFDLYVPGIAETPPDGAEASPLPVVVMIPGGPDTPGAYGYPRMGAVTLAAQGAVVLVAAWRQGERYGAAPPAALGDITCAVVTARWLAPRFGVDPDRVVLIGHSLGAWAGMVIALSPAAIAPSAGCLAPGGSGSPRPDAFVGLAGPYASLRDGTRADAWDAILGSATLTDPIARAAVDPLALAMADRPVSVPVLLAHGEADGSILIEESVAMAAALEAAGDRPVLVRLPVGVDHDAILTDPRAIGPILAFLRDD